MTNDRALAIRAEMASVLLQSKRYGEAAAEYKLLVALNPDNFAYRLGLARSLAWGKQPRPAEQATLELLRRRPGHPEYEAMLLSVRSQITPIPEEAERWLEAYPRSFEYRHMLARALARSRRNNAAVAQYDTLIAQRSLTALFLERGQVHFAAGNLTAAERDADVAVRGIGSAPSWILLGEVHRARGNLVAARAAIAQAARGRPRDLDVRAASARLARDEHPPAAFMPDVSEVVGVLTSASTSSDNLGANLTTSTARWGGRLGDIEGLDASAGVTTRWISERGASPESGPSAFGADAALSREGVLGIYYARARVRAGFLHHPAGDVIPDASFAGNLFVRAWGLGVELFTTPAYPSLLTLASFLPFDDSDAQLTEKGATFSLAGPIHEVDIAASHQSASISDGNVRRTLRGYARAPVHETLSLVYSGISQSFTQPSLLYWAPIRYIGHGAGPELSYRQQRGLSASVRVLPGFAWSTVRDTIPGEPPIESTAFQLSGSGDVSYRAANWELLGALGYGRGRAGEYQRVDATVQLRYTP